MGHTSCVRSTGSRADLGADLSCAERAPHRDPDHEYRRFRSVEPCSMPERYRAPKRSGPRDTPGVTSDPIARCRSLQRWVMASQVDVRTSDAEEVARGAGAELCSAATILEIGGCHDWWTLLVPFQEVFVA